MGNDIRQQEGLIIARYNKNIALEDSSGAIIQCVNRKSVGDLVCGDKVIWEQTDNGRGVVTAVLPRSSLLSRPDRREQLKPVAANIDQLAIVCVAQLTNDNWRLNTDLIDHYLVAAEIIEIRPIILLNKIDLIEEPALAEIDALLDDYRHIGYEVIFSSTREKNGLESLINAMSDKTSVFVGESGVGKSSLIKMLLPDLEIRIGALSSLSGLGKHTTTTAMLYHLPQGGRLIDSPGVREFGLSNIDQEQLAAGFREFRDYSGQCKFRNCRHLSEPGCAIQAAVNNGRIQPRRLASYRAILQSLPGEQHGG